jgi:hypothetical protein
MYLRETRQKRATGSLVTHLQLAESVWNSQKKRVCPTFYTAFCHYCESLSLTY